MLKKKKAVEIVAEVIYQLKMKREREMLQLQGCVTVTSKSTALFP